MIKKEKELLAGIVSNAVQYNVAGLPKGLCTLAGHTSPRQRAFLNDVCGNLDKECVYLEVGVFHGASLLSAARQNTNGQFYGVDDFSYGTRKAYDKAYKKFWNDCDHAQIIEGDIRKLTLDKLPKKVNVFFFDANWTNEASSTMLKALAPILDETFILIVDNWSRPYVRRLTYDAIEELGFSTYASWQLTSEADCDINGWWSGWGVFVIEKKPMRDTTKLREFKEDEVPIWDIATRLEKKLFTIEDYDGQKSN